MPMIHKRFSTGLCCLLILSFLIAYEACADSLSPQALQAARKTAAQKERRIIFDNDGNEPVYYCSEATEEVLLEQRTLGVIGSQVDTIVYCTWSSGFSYFTHDTKVGVVFDSTAEEPGKGPGSGFSKNKTRAFLDQGTDALRIMTDFCRKKDIEIFWSMRMNDIHDAWAAWYSPYLFPPLKKEHPEWLMGTAKQKPVNGGWTSVDYGQPEIRDLAFKFFEEVCHNYDVDGVEMDFFRHLCFFRKHANGQACGKEEQAMMTDLLRRVRTMADARGAERGRPILLSVRVPDSLELCKAVGLDIETWMREGLIDLLVLSGYFRLNAWEESVALAKRYDVPVYPCLSECRIRDGEAKKTRSSLESYRARAAEVLASGADGVYMFNFFNPHSSLWHEVGSQESLKGLDKVYSTATRGNGNLNFWYEGGTVFQKRDFINPDSPRSLEPGKTESAQLFWAEDIIEGKFPAVTLKVRFKEAVDASAITVFINETPLEKVRSEGNWLVAPVDSASFKQGYNSIALQLADTAPAPLTLLDLLVPVEYGEE